MNTTIPRELIDHVPQLGRLEWIGVRPERLVPMIARERAALLTDRGVEGDRAAERSGGRRQVTLVQWEHLDVIARLMRIPSVDPGRLRRNLAISGIPLRALARRRFAIGDAVLEGVGECFPCSRMETELGDGGFAAMRGHGGIIARVLSGAVVCAGDTVRALPIERG